MEGCEESVVTNCYCCHQWLENSLYWVSKLGEMALLLQHLLGGKGGWDYCFSCILNYCGNCVGSAALMNKISVSPYPTGVDMVSFLDVLHNSTFFFFLFLDVFGYLMLFSHIWLVDSYHAHRTFTLTFVSFPGSQVFSKLGDKPRIKGISYGISYLFLKLWGFMFDTSKCLATFLRIWVCGGFDGQQSLSLRRRESFVPGDPFWFLVPFTSRCPGGEALVMSQDKVREWSQES